MASLAERRDGEGVALLTQQSHRLIVFSKGMFPEVRNQIYRRLTRPGTDHYHRSMSLLSLKTMSQT
jgi:hypothetical protein